MEGQSPRPPPSSRRPAGWYKDPSGRYDWRYFDGTWFDEVQNEGDDRTYIDPVPSAQRSPATQHATTPSAAQGTTAGVDSATEPRWWRRKFWKLPTWAWGALGLAAIIGGAVGAVGSERPDTAGEATTTAPSAAAAADATSPTSDAAGTVGVGSPAEPNVSPAALDFIDADECRVQTLEPDGTAGWYRCTRVNVEGDGATSVAYITEDSDPVAALAYAQTTGDYNENVSVLYNVAGGGVVYFPDNFDWPMFDVGPYPDLEVVDTDCAPFPEPNPQLCPALPASGSGSETETSAGLTQVSAWSACRAYGDGSFRYGWDPHNVLGMITNEIVDDGWFFKLEADVTNEFGAEAAGVVECTVSGTDDSPNVDSFIFY